MRHTTAKRTMTAAEVKAILDLLTPEDPSLFTVRDEYVSINGISGASEWSYFDDSTCKDIWEQLYIVSHNYGERTDGKFKIVFAPKYGSSLARAAARMFPGGYVQLELDFFHVRGTIYQVGHIGITGFDKKYWVLALIICESENKDTAYTLIDTAITMIEKQGGLVEFALVDGGSALESAIKKLNVEQEKKNKLITRLRLCFAHAGKMPGRHHTGMRGGRGSVPRGLLERGVSYEDMGKVR